MEWTTDQSTALSEKESRVARERERERERERGRLGDLSYQRERENIMS